MPVVIPQALTPSAFAPYGDVIEHLGLERRLHLSQAFTCEPQAKTPSLWISRIDNPTHLPLTIDELERHPYSNQTFVPLGPIQMLVIVACSTPDGVADLETLAAFVTKPGQGITYHRNVWHFGLSTMEAPADFVVAMSVTGDHDDSIFQPLPHPIRISDTLQADI